MNGPSLQKVSALMVVLLLAGAPLAADSIRLRSGRVIQGVIISQTRTSVLIRTSGRTRRISKRSIRRIRYGPVVARPKKRPPVVRKPRPKVVKKKPKRHVAAHIKKPTVRPKQSAGIGRVGRLWRSALLPGWGQWAGGSRTSGMVVAGTFVAAAAYAGSASSAVSAARADYSSQVNTSLLLSTAFGASQGATQGAALHGLLSSGGLSSYDAASNRFNIALGIVGVVYLGQLIHAFVFSPAPPGRRTAGTYENEGPRWFFSLGPAVRPRSGPERRGRMAGAFGVEISL